MSDFKYFELLAFFYSSIFKHVKQGTDLDQANIRVYDDFWLFPVENNYLNNLIVYINYMNVVYALRNSFTTQQIEVYNNQTKLVKENINLSDWLKKDELEHFRETVDQLNYEIANWESENTIA